MTTRETPPGKPVVHSRKPEVSYSETPPYGAASDFD